MPLFKKTKKEESNDVSADTKVEKATKTLKSTKVSTAEPKKAKPESKEVVVRSEVTSGVPSGVVIRPYITEKSGLLSQQGSYTFEVSRSANKKEISKAINSLYKVNPVRVSLVNLPSKTVFVRGKWGKVSGVRKAVVTLKKGDKIDFI